MRPREYSVASILDEKNPEKLQDMLIQLLGLYINTLAELRRSASKAKNNEF